MEGTTQTSVRGRGAEDPQSSLSSNDLTGGARMTQPGDEGHRRVPSHLKLDIKLTSQINNDETSVLLISH